MDTELQAKGEPLAYHQPARRRSRCCLHRGGCYQGQELETYDRLVLSFPNWTALCEAVIPVLHGTRTTSLQAGFQRFLSHEQETEQQKPLVHLLAEPCGTHRVGWILVKLSEITAHSQEKQLFTLFITTCENTKDSQNAHKDEPICPRGSLNRLT